MPGPAHRAILDAAADLVAERGYRNLRQQEEGGAEPPETGDLEADLSLLLRRTARGLVDPRFDEPFRALTT